MYVPYFMLKFIHLNYTSVNQFCYEILKLKSNYWSKLKICGNLYCTILFKIEYSMKIMYF